MLGMTLALRREMRLRYQSVFAPLRARPAEPQGTDALAHLPRAFLEVATRGLQN
jgi:hypothetical protein